MKLGKKSRRELKRRRRERNVHYRAYQFLAVGRKNPHYIFVNGNLGDIKNIPRFEAELFDYIHEYSGDMREIVLDLGGVEGLHTSGIASIVIAKQRARRRNLDVCLSNLNGNVKDILDITRLYQIFRKVPPIPSNMSYPKITQSK